MGDEKYGTETADGMTGVYATMTDAIRAALSEADGDPEIQVWVHEPTCVSRALEDCPCRPVRVR